MVIMKELYMDPRMGSWDQTDTISDIFFIFSNQLILQRGSNGFSDRL